MLMEPVIKWNGCWVVCEVKALLEHGIKEESPSGTVRNRVEKYRPGPASD